MAKRLPGEVYAELTAAGFDPQAAVTLTAIAGAESGYDTTALGDQGLQDNTWGPSFGLFQVRTVKADTGTGGDRDIAALASGDAAQIQAAYDISHGGTDFSPWTTYTRGTYQQYLPAAQAAAGATPATNTGITSWLTSGTSGILAGVRSIGLEGLFVVLGLGLLAGGLFLTVAPTMRRVGRSALGAAGAVGAVAR